VAVVLSMLQNQKKRLLVVDSDSQVLSKISRMLFGLGAWDVWQANTAARAAELWTEHHDEINVLITAPKLPDGLGTDLVQQFRAKRPGLYVLFMSGGPACENREWTEEFLPKPFTNQQLLDALSRLEQ
jgi:DNA-binding NtrC family response regulator